MSTRHLYFNLYAAGLSNQRMSLEIAVGLAYLTGRKLVFPTYPPLHHSGKLVRDLRITDLFDVPLAMVDIRELPPLTAGGANARCDWDHQPFTHLVFTTPEYAEQPPDELGEFMFYRSRIASIAPGSDLDTANTLYLSGSRHFCQYSTFFFLPEEQKTRLYQTINSIRPKQAYLDLARDIAGSLGSFNAIHLRRGDFKSFYGTSSVSPRTIIDNLVNILPQGVRLLIATDEPGDSAFFDPIREAWPESLFLNEYIQENSEFSSCFRRLPVSNWVSLGLVSQLVCAEAVNFAGTLLSTFTNYIHRLRGWHGTDTRLRYCYSHRADLPLVDGEFPENGTGRFSWTRCNWVSVDPVTRTANYNPTSIAWQREWRESWETKIRLPAG